MTRKLKDIIESIANANVELICEKCEEFIVKCDVNGLAALLEGIVANSDDLQSIREIISSDDKEKIRVTIRSILDDQGKDWAENMSKYLNYCVTNINLDEIVIEESDRARGIDIYENLNLGGVKLSVFDLLIARSAQASKEPLNERLENCINKTPLYNVESYISNPSVLHEYSKLPKTSQFILHTASYNMDCLKNGELPKIFTDAFMNVLSLIVNGGDLKKQELKLDWIKSKKILELTPAEINENCERVCDAIDKALFFLQVRGGVRKISEINYALMLTVLAYILYFESQYGSNKLHKVLNLLEGWYWSSIFSGKYDKDQNSTIIKDINNLVCNVVDIMGGCAVDTTWLNERKDMVLECPGFSSEEFIINGDLENKTYPKSVLADAVCQYYLSQAYYDLTSGQTLLCAFYENVKSLEIHHVIPLGAGTIRESTEGLRKDKGCFLNFPMNLLYISPEANKEISAKSLSEYAVILPNYASIVNVHFPNVSITSKSSNDDKKNALRSRYTYMKANLSARIQNLLNV